jgi:hypothetical protein
VGYRFVALKAGKYQLMAEQLAGFAKDATDVIVPGTHTRIRE